MRNGIGVSAWRETGRPRVLFSRLYVSKGRETNSGQAWPVHVGEGRKSTRLSRPCASWVWHCWASWSVQACWLLGLLVCVGLGLGFVLLGPELGKWAYNYTIDKLKDNMK